MSRKGGPGSWRCAALASAGACLAMAAAAQPAPVPVAATRATPLPPAELFFKPPAIHGAVLSPSGRWLAMSTGIAAKRTGLVVADLQQWPQVKPVVRFTDADIGTFEWVDDERLIFSIRDSERGDADQRFAPGLFSVRRDGSSLRQLVDSSVAFFRDASGPTRRPLSPNHVLLHVPKGDTAEVIVGELLFEGNVVSTVNAKRLNVDTGRATNLSIGRPDHATNWLFDPAGEPRLISASQGGRTRIHWRAPGEDGWKVLAEFDSLDAPFQPAFIDADNQLYVTANAGRAGLAVLKRFDFARNRPEDKPLVSTPGFDFRGGLVVERAGGKAWGVRTDTDAETTVWFDDRLKAVQTEADAKLAGHINRLACRRCGEADMTVLVRSWSDQDPGQYWVYQAAAKTWLKVGAVRPDIEPSQMATVDFHRITARDGRDLPVWVTRAPGPANGRPLPAVVLVHGGPWVRGGHWAFDDWSQFLASRGYVVIAPEFRGSTGYGAEHFRAGWKQWGLSMQDDVADALLWARRTGLADADKACIMGASYGGYATLMGLVRHPTLYRCGVAWVAVTDPKLLFEWQFGSDVSDESRRYGLPRMLGDPAADAAALTAASPMARAADITRPLLMAFGAQDRRVPLVHGSRLKDALTSLGRPPEYVVYPGEGHGGWKLDHELDFAGRVERFLSNNLR